MPSFTDCIPDEIVVKFLQLCYYTEVLRFSQTCKTYHDLVTRSSRFQLQIELQSSGYQVSDEGLKKGGEGTAKRLLEEFRRFRDGWLYMKIGKPLRLEPVDSDMRLYELRQGYYAAALSTTHNLPSIVKLTSLHDNGMSRHLSLGVQFSEFQIDPSQGLLVMVAIEAVSVMSTIHLRSIYKANPHSSALHPDLTVQLPFHTERRSSGIFIEVMDDLLAVKYVSFEKDLSNILIWNWKSGRLLNRIEVSGRSCTFGFLTADSILLFQSTGLPSVNLLVYNDIRTASHSSGEYQPTSNVSDWPAMTPAFEFGFPEFPETSFTYLLMRSEPVPTLYSTGPATFLPSPEARAIQLSMTVLQNGGPGRGLNQYQIFLSKERLLRHLDPSSGVLASLSPSPPQSPTSSTSSSPSNTVRVPWEAWGEHTTRWFNTTSAISPWICRAYGTRFIQALPSSHDDSDLDFNFDQPLEYLSILEFHQPTVRRFSSLGCDKHLSMWESKEGRRHLDLSCTEEEAEYFHNTLRSGRDGGGGEEVFVDTIDDDVPSLTPFNDGIVVTRLPYRVVTRRKPVVKHSGWMMDNNLIIGMPPWQGDDMENVQNEYMNIFTPMA